MNPTRGQTRRIVLVCGTGALAMLVLIAAASVAAEPSAPTFVKITLGIGDAKGRDWSGSVRVDGGRIVDMRPWAFETRHKIDAEQHSWVCDSAVKVARGRTRFAEPQRGIVVAVQGPSSARLSVDTEQGSFACRLSDLRPGRIMPALGGAASVELTMTPLEAAAAEGEEDYPAIAVEAAGRLCVAWVSWEQEADVIYARSFDGRALRVTDHPANDWEPALACDGKGTVYVAWDTYRNGNYDVYLRRMAPEPLVSRARQSGVLQHHRRQERTQPEGAVQAAA